MSVNCLKCIYFRITWEPDHPRACEYFGFKGKELPSVTVEKTYGKPCPFFKKKDTIIENNEK